MGETRTLDNVVVHRLGGGPMKVPRRDEDGEVVWKDPDAPRDQREPAELLDMTVWDALRHVATSVPQGVRKNDDPYHGFLLMQQLITQKGAPQLEIDKAQYDWVHGVLKRPVPLSKEDKEAGFSADVLGAAWWGQNAYGVALALTAREDREAGD